MSRPSAGVGVVVAVAVVLDFQRAVIEYIQFPAGEQVPAEGIGQRPFGKRPSFSLVSLINSSPSISQSFGEDHPQHGRGKNQDARQPGIREIILQLASGPT